MFSKVYGRFLSSEYEIWISFSSLYTVYTKVAKICWLLNGRIIPLLMIFKNLLRYSEKMASVTFIILDHLMEGRVIVSKKIY